MVDNVWREEVLKTTGVFDDRETDLHSMMRLVNKNIPENVYRYRSGHPKDLDALRKGYEWLSYPDNYNDPFDARIFYNEEEIITPAANMGFNKKLKGDFAGKYKQLTGERELGVNDGRGDFQIINKSKIEHGLKYMSVEESCLKMAEQWKSIFHKIKNDAEDTIRKKALICSFTTRRFNYLMWAHYTGSHKGYCLEYESPGFLLNDGFFLPIAYRDSPVDVTGLIKKGIKGEVSYATSAAMGSALIKSSAWEYESEWRYIYFGEKNDRELSGLNLKRLLLGCNADKKFTQEVMQICQERKVEVVRQKRSPNSYDLIDGERLV